jgi:hypothetical protein
VLAADPIYPTTDLSVAAFLCVRGARLIKTVEVGDDRERLSWHFDDAGGMATELSLRFIGSRESLYDAHLRTLKKATFGVCRQPRAPDGEVREVPSLFLAAYAVCRGAAVVGWRKVSGGRPRDLVMLLTGVPARLEADFETSPERRYDLAMLHLKRMGTEEG